MFKKLVILFCLFFSLQINTCFAGKLIPQDLAIIFMTQYEYLSDRIQFPDSFDHYQSPKDFMKNRKGDCDDFAITSYYILKKLGYETQMYSLKLPEGGHAITVFKQEGVYNIFSNQYIYYTLETDPIKAINFIYSEWSIICKFIPIKYGDISIWHTIISKRIIRFNFRFFNL